MSGWKDWQQLEVVTEADFQSYIQDQVVQYYANSAARSSAVPLPTVGMVSYLDDTNSLEVRTTEGWTPLKVQDYTSQNFVINGAFDIWQRGTSIDGASFPYTADRWRANNNADATFTRQTTSLNDFQYALRLQRDSGASSTTGVQLRNIFETVNSIPLAGKTVTLSVYARAGADFSGTGMTLTIQTGTGVDQNPYSGLTGVVNNGLTTPAITTDWVRYTTTATLPTNATQIAVGIQYTPSGTAGANDWMEITGVQLEAGSVATPFRRHAPSLQGELAACQRYYYKSANPSVLQRFVNMSASTANLFIPITLPVTMRANPSLTVKVDINDGAEISASGVIVADSTYVTAQVNSVPSTQHTDLRLVEASAEL